MAYGKSLKKNFYTGDNPEIAMPPLGEMPPVLADTPELLSKSEAPIQNQVQPLQPETNNNEDYDEELDEVEYDKKFFQKESEVEQEVEQPKTKQSDNFRALREARERAEWERDMLKSQMAEMQRSMRGEQPAPKQQEVIEEADDFDFNVADDALLEGKDAKRLVQELKKVKQQLKKFGSQSTETAIEAKIRATYPDFNDVVSQENVARLNKDYPEIAQTLRDTPDLFNKASSAYSIIKRFGIYKDMTYEEDKMKAIKNSQKPRPVASVNPQQGDSPLSKANAFANGLSKELQKQLLAEMAAARKNM